jgi:hypothetical protein
VKSKGEQEMNGKLPQLIVSLALGLAVGQAQAAPPDSLWSLTLGGFLNEKCYSASQTADSGYVLGGYSRSFAGNEDFWLAKVNVNGDSLWSNTFGGNDQDYCRAAQQTSEGGYMMAGYTESFGAGGWDAYLVKTDVSGLWLWERTYGGTANDYCWSAQQTSDDGYALAGETWSSGAGGADFWLVKTNANGNVLWDSTYGGTADDKCHSMQQTSDNGYILAGETWSNSAGSADFWMVKTDATGDSLWSRRFGGGGSDICYSVRQTSDNGYVLAGQTFSFGAAGGNFWLVKTDSLGDSLWSRAFGGGESEVCYSVRETTDGGFILAGNRYTGSGMKDDFWLVKASAIGDSLWSRTFGGSEQDICYTAEETFDGGFYLAGTTASFGMGNYDFWLVKTGTDPDLLQPRNLVAWPDGDSLRLTWQSAPLAISYDVMWAPEPFGGVWSLLTSTGDTVAVDTVGVGAKRFYSVMGTN